MKRKETKIINTKPKTRLNRNEAVLQNKGK